MSWTSRLHRGLVAGFSILVLARSAEADFRDTPGAKSDRDSRYERQRSGAAPDEWARRLEDPQPEVRLETVKALAESNDPKAHDLLMQAVEDPDPRVATTAVDALGAERGEIRVVVSGAASVPRWNQFGPSPAHPDRARQDPRPNDGTVDSRVHPGRRRSATARHGDPSHRRDRRRLDPRRFAALRRAREGRAIEDARERCGGEDRGPSGAHGERRRPLTPVGRRSRSSAATLPVHASRSVVQAIEVFRPIAADGRVSARSDAAGATSAEDGTWRVPRPPVAPSLRSCSRSARPRSARSPLCPAGIELACP